MEEIVKFNHPNKLNQLKTQKNNQIEPSIPRP